MSSEMMMPAAASEMMGLAKVCELLVKSSFCGVKKPEDALWIVATGHSLGIDPVTSLRGIHVISGKPVLSADLMAAVAMRHPDCLCLQVVEMTPLKATVKVQRRGWSEPTLVSFSVEDAKNAGLLNNPTWKKYPADMCKARAIARAARAAFPDALLGVYVEGELDEPQAATVTYPSAVDVTPPTARPTRDEQSHAEGLKQIATWMRTAEMGKYANAQIATGIIERYGGDEGSGAATLRDLSPAALYDAVQHLALEIDRHGLQTALRNLTEWTPRMIETDLAGPERTPSAA